MSKKLLSFLSALSIVSSAFAFNVTFQVDMSQQSGFTTPEVNGSFNNWCGNCFQMSDDNGDNITTNETEKKTWIWDANDDNMKTMVLNVTTLFMSVIKIRRQL